MPSRQISLLLSLTATCLFCFGCGSDPTPSGKATSPSMEETRLQNLRTRSPEPPQVGFAEDPSKTTDPGPKPSTTPPSSDAQPDLQSADSKATDADSTDVQPDEAAEDPEEAAEDPEEQTIQIPSSWVRLSKVHEIWIDMKSKRVMVAGQICLRQGALEVFACPRRTKEHESVISVNASALELHTCLIAIGADPGKPVQWTPEYKPATGPKINIDVVWSEDGKETTRNAKELVRNFETKKVLDKDWVFCGSQFYVNPQDGSKTYYGDSGEMICLSNFSTASLDLPVESSGSNEMLLFESNTEKIPPVGTKVYLVLSVLDEDVKK